MIWCCLFSCSLNAESKIKGAIKDELIGQPIGMFFDKIFSYKDILSSKLNNNLVHSAKYGMGFPVNIKNWKNKVTIYANPVNSVGKKVHLFKNNYLLPGRYQITTAKGTKSYILKVNEVKSLDYFKLMEFTETDGNKKIGRIRIKLTPKNSNIIIYGTPHKYHDGLQLPEGKYRVKVSHNGYETQERIIKVEKYNLTKESFKLQKIKVEKYKLTKGNRKVGWIRIELTPKNSKIIIYGTPYKYHDGLQLPEGKYRVKVSHNGYETQERIIKVEKYKLTKESFKLKEIKGRTSKNKMIFRINWNKVYLLPSEKFSFAKLNIKHSFQQLIIAARNGDADAKIQVAMMYMHGVGILQDFDKAEYWFKKSAEDQHPQGQKMYGYTFPSSQKSQAFKYIKKAAQQGDMEAQYLTSRFYRDGVGVKRNKEKAEYWLNKAIGTDMWGG